MNVSTMRTVDRLVGVPLCLMTGLWLRLTGPQRDIPPEKWKTILVVKFFGMGSLLLSTPFLSAVRQHIPNATIAFLTFSANTELLDKLTQPDVRLTIDTSSAVKFVVSTFKVIRKLRGMPVDVVFDLEFFSKYSTLISSLSGAPVRVGYELPTQWRRSNLTHPATFDTTAHVTQVFLRQLSPFNITVAADLEIERLEATPEEVRSMEMKLEFKPGAVENICVNINAGPTSLERRWEPQRFAEVLTNLMHEKEARKYFFIGNEEERGYVQRLLDTHPHLLHAAVNCAGLLTIGEMVALLQRCSLLITSDSGPMHVAMATGTPVVALFGPESPQFYGPVGNCRVVYKAISCSPCLNVYNAKLFVCPYNARCMKEITVTEVVAATQSLLSNHAIRSHLKLHDVHP